MMQICETSREKVIEWLLCQNDLLMSKRSVEARLPAQLAEPPLSAPDHFWCFWHQKDRIYKYKPHLLRLQTSISSLSSQRSRMKVVWKGIIIRGLSSDNNAFFFPKTPIPLTSVIRTQFVLVNDPIDVLTSRDTAIARSITILAERVNL